MYDKNILFVTTYNPYVQKTGAHQRTRHLFNALKQTAHVDVLFFNLYDKDVPVTDSHVFMYDVDLEAGALSKLKGCVPFGQHVIALKNGRCSRIYREVIQRRKYDVVVFRYLATAVMCGVEDYADIVIDIDDIPWHNYHKMAENPSYSWIKRGYFGYKSWGIKRVAFRIMKRCRLYYTANPQDCLTDNSRYLPNIPAILESQDYVSGCNKNILFVGFMAFPPNYQGVDHFINYIWKNVCRKHPDAHFYVVGKGTPEHLRKAWESYPHVHVLGFVDDLKEMYRKCSVVVSPVYSGAGTNIKVLEALAMKKICILSDFAFKGFDVHLTNGVDLLVARSDSDYTVLLDKVLSDVSACMNLAVHGYVSIRKNYTSRAVVSVIKDSLLPDC